ncbi:alpha/beta fold hydrolase [Runella sp.]|uniref:alpha/beta fold hydrolase n=1 Tax=Runella sp. TaxID=1960881 RepID=UPI003D0CFEEC
MKKFVLFLLFFTVVLFTQAQRTIPYPIIFVHGWVGNDSTWYGMGDWLKNQGLNVNLNSANKRAGDGSLIDFHLNADGNNSYSELKRSLGPFFYGDVYDYNSIINPENDIFFVNFDNEKLPNTSSVKEYSNQAGVVKQGFAIGLAVRKVLNATKAQKVILVGHSMGGLAIREYLQNSENWLIDGKDHHVAKLVTIGTPHGGSMATTGNLSNAFKGFQERSEAVRDLRSPEIYTNPLVDRGVYLFGGDENNILRFALINYLNFDVNCNGKLDNVVGLNQKQFPSFVPVSCGFGTGSTLGGDGVVSSSSASLFNILPKQTWDEIFEYEYSKEDAIGKQYYSDNDKSVFGTWHTKLTKQILMNMAVMDEPSHGSVAFSIDLDRKYIGFLTKRPNDTRYDSVSIPV